MAHLPVLELIARHKMILLYAEMGTVFARHEGALVLEVS
jgi:hypothetical protein